jgi:bacteriocin-like protein
MDDTYETRAICHQRTVNMPTDRRAQMTKPTDQNQNESSVPPRAELNEAELAKITGGTVADVGKQIMAGMKYELGIPITTHATTLT